MDTASRLDVADDTRAILRRLAGGACVLCLFSTAERATQLNTAPRGSWVLLDSISFWFFWAILSVPALWAIRRINGRRALVVRMAGHVLAATVLMVVHSMALYFVQRTAHLVDLQVSFLWSTVMVTRWRLTVNLLAYVAIVGVIRFSRAEQVATERQHASLRLAEQLSAARLDALRLQLNPHFLFNALNTVAMLVRRGAARDAVHAITRLAELLRQLLNDNGAHTVPLKEELALLDRYLDLERLRFGDRLRVVHDIDDAQLDVRVPPFLLQPIVENAIRHGIARVVQGGTLRISARRVGLGLEMAIANDGPGIDGTPGMSSGVGLANTVSRLNELYGTAFDLDIHSVPGGTVARIVVPVLTSGATVRHDMMPASRAAFRTAS